jgi:hypothetical protein
MPHQASWRSPLAHLAYLRSVVLSAKPTVRNSCRLVHSSKARQALALNRSVIISTTKNGASDATTSRTSLPTRRIEARSESTRSKRVHPARREHRLSWRTCRQCCPNREAKFTMTAGISRLRIAPRPRCRALLSSLCAAPCCCQRTMPTWPPVCVFLRTEVT